MEDIVMHLRSRPVNIADTISSLAASVGDYHDDEDISGWCLKIAEPFFELGSVVKFSKREDWMVEFSDHSVLHFISGDDYLKTWSCLAEMLHHYRERDELQTTLADLGWQLDLQH